MNRNYIEIWFPICLSGVLLTLTLLLCKLGSHTQLTPIQIMLPIIFLGVCLITTVFSGAYFNYKLDKEEEQARKDEFSYNKYKDDWSSKALNGQYGPTIQRYEMNKQLKEAAILRAKQLAEDKRRGAIDEEVDLTIINERSIED